MKIKSVYLKVFVILLSIFLATNFFLFFMRKIGELVFWAVIIVSAIFAYFILPEIKKT